MKKLMLVLSMFALLSLIGFEGPEQIEVKGTVYEAGSKQVLPGVNVVIKGTSNGTVTDSQGRFRITSSPQATLVFSYIGYASKEVKVKGRKLIDIYLDPDVKQLEEHVVMSDFEMVQESHVMGSVSHSKKANGNGAFHSRQYPAEYEQFNTEEYATIHENIFHEALKKPLSTFSIDVDAASYSNVRRFVDNGQLPPKDAVRIEELINYFNYDYPEPTENHPFSVNMEMASCPWNAQHQLVHIGLQGKNIPVADLPPSNLVFLIDVSGSMAAPNKLPLLVSAMRLLTQQMRPQDRVAMVVYAGAAGLVLPSTPGTEKEKILKALNKLQAGGSTAGGAGIKLAYKTAMEHYLEEGNNRVILATDGDFNIGASSNAEMERLIEKKRESGVFLTVLGFGMGNYKDSKMEILANKGNGNYAYIDNIQEAKKVLVSEFGGTLFTIAKDVKIQVEFNPARVKGYRLIGYENRKLQDEDFNDDKKDAGELGAGHTVTALYEIIPVGTDSEGFLKDIDELKYQKEQHQVKRRHSDEWMTVKLRYKDPDGTISKLITTPLKAPLKSWSNSSDNFRWSAAVAVFGQVIRDSEFRQEGSYELALRLAQSAKGQDEQGYRRDFIRMIENVSLMARK